MITIEEERQPICKCCECEQKLYFGNCIWNISEDIYCDYCGLEKLEKEHKREIDENFVDNLKPDYLD